MQFIQIFLYKYWLVCHCLSAVALYRRELSKLPFRAILQKSHLMDVCDMGSFVLAIMWFFSYTCHESANSPFCAHLHLIWSFSTALHVYLYFHLGAWSFLYACFDNRAKQISQMDIKKKKNGICLVCAVVFGTGGMLFTASFTALYMGFWWFPRCDVCGMVPAVFNGQVSSERFETDFWVFIFHEAEKTE